MTTFNLSDLLQPLTRTDVEASIYEVLTILGVDAGRWKTTSVVRAAIRGCSVVLASLSTLQARIARLGFLEHSEGPWLTLLAHHVYAVDRIQATFGAGELTLTNSGGGIFAFDPDDLIFANPSTGSTYRNTGSVSVGALATVVIPIQAIEAGSGSSSGVGEISSLVTTVLGLSASNAAPLVGTDEESDSALRARCQEKLGSLSPFGAWDSYTFALRSATRPDGTNLSITRVRILRDGYGNVELWVAGPSGAISDPDDIEIANAAIAEAATPLCVTAVASSATNTPVDVTYEVWLYDTSTFDDDQIKVKIEDALDAFFAAQPIGGNVVSGTGRVYVNGIRSAIFDALPEVFQALVTEPAADVEFTHSDVAVRGEATATAIHREPRPEGFGGALG